MTPISVTDVHFITAVNADGVTIGSEILIASILDKDKAGKTPGRRCSEHRHGTQIRKNRVLQRGHVRKIIPKRTAGQKVVARRAMHQNGLSNLNVIT